MPTPDMFNTVGFKGHKVGSGDKELGYAISKSSLFNIAFVVILAVAALSSLVMISFFEVKLERRQAHHQLRHVEHHDASKLAKVEMQLWSHFHADIHDSHEARSLLAGLNTSYLSLHSQLQESIANTTKDLNVPADKAAALTEKVLRAVTDHRQHNLHRLKGLLDHLIQVGKKSVLMEKHMDKEMKHEMHREVEQDEYNTADEAHTTSTEPRSAAAGGHNHTREEDEEEDDKSYESKELSKIVTNVWRHHDTFITKFAGAFADLEKTNALLKPLQEWATTHLADTSDEELEDKLKEFDFKSINVDVDYINVFTPRSFVEELLLVPSFAKDELATLKNKFLEGTMDGYTVLNQLHELQGNNKIPANWLIEGVDEEEDLEEEDEERYEQDEFDHDHHDGHFDHDDHVDHDDHADHDVDHAADHHADEHNTAPMHV